MKLAIITGRQYIKGEIAYALNIFEYKPREYKYYINKYVTDKNGLNRLVAGKDIYLFNAKIHSDNKVYLIDAKKDGLKKFIEYTLKKCRVYIEYISDGDVAGYCIEASELIVAIFKFYGFNDCKTVEGWCQYDDDAGCSDRDYDEHTWVEILSGKYYIDITADQFNYHMYKQNEYAPIIFQMDLPHGMCYEEPEGYEPEDGWDE